MAKKTSTFQQRKITITLLYAASGVNGILASILSLWTSGEVHSLMFVFGLILLILMTPTVWVSNRKDNNSSLAVGGAFGAFLFCGIIDMLISHPWIMLVVHLLELGGYYFFVRKTRP